MLCKRIGTLLVVWAVVALALNASLAAQERDAEVALQQAMHVEQVEGNLDHAIQLYRDIVARYAGVRAVAAKALLQLGQCYEKLGRTEATSAYQRLVGEYGDQSEEVAAARARLAALQQAPAEGRGPVARRLLSSDETDMNNLILVTPSPDGRFVAYTHLGSDQALCVRDLATGEERCLASGLPQVMNFSPVWSPDGKRLAFLAADMQTGSGEIKVVDLASRAVVAVPGTRTENQNARAWMMNLIPVDWSRDGRFLLCRTTVPTSGTDTRPIGLVLVPVAGGDRVVLVDSLATEGSAAVSPAALSPDGRFVAYVAGPSDSEQVFVKPTTRGGERRAVTDAPGGNSSPHWSPDGRAIAYTRSDGIWVVPMENGRATGMPKLAYASASADLTAFAWTDAGGLYFASWVSATTPYRFPVDPGSGAPGDAPPERLPRFPSVVHTFAWSPDAKRVAFVGYQLPEVSVYDADRNVLEAHRVDPEPWHFRVGWSSDGKEVLYQGRRSPAGVNWLALDPSTGHVRELTPRQRDRIAVGFSADGSRILYSDTTGLSVAVAGQAVGVRVAPIATPDAGRLSPLANSQISQRGDRVLFARRPPDSYPNGSALETLWVVDGDGTGLRQVARITMFVSAVWDPSGRFIAYSGLKDSTTTVLRVLELATGTEHDFRVPVSKPSLLKVVDWSADGRYIGVVSPEERVEYWVVQGLLDAAR